MKENLYECTPICYAGTTSGQRTGATGNYLMPITFGSGSNSVVIRKVIITNFGGSTYTAGMIGWIKSSLWKAGQYTASGTAYTDDTTDAQDSDTNDFALSTLTNNDGYMIQSSVPFNFVLLDITTYANGAPTYEYTVYDSTSADFSTSVTAIETAPTYQTTEFQYLVFAYPNIWTVGKPAGVTALDSDKYVLRARATTAPGTTAPLAKQMWIGRMLFWHTGLATKGVYEWPAIGDGDIDINDDLYSGLSYYWGTPTTGNTMQIIYGYRSR